MDIKESRRWLRRYDTVESETRVVVLPHAGGSASFYRPLSAALSRSTEVLVAQYPGRQERRSEPPVTDLLELAELIVTALAAQPATGRTAIFGHSMGATLGFEVVRKLEGTGGAISSLFASGRRAPSRPRLRRDGGAVPMDLSDARLVRELRILGGTDPTALDDEEVLRMILPAVRGDYEAIEGYRYSPRPDPRIGGAVIGLLGASDPSTHQDDVSAWAQHTSGPFSMHVFAGGHFYFAEQWTAVASVIERGLDERADRHRLSTVIEAPE